MTDYGAMSEAELQALAVEVALQCGWIAYHTHDSRRSDPGFPDVVFARPPTVLFVEFKSATGRVRPEQTIWLDALEQCENVASGLVRPDDIDALIARLKLPPGNICKSS